MKLPYKNTLKNKKVLVFGLGLLGGGVATTNWLIRHGARVTITDLKTKEQLAPALKKINGQVKLKLGGHHEEDINANDLIVLNPDVPFGSKYVKCAIERGKDIENEASLFYKYFGKSIIGVTGTRGKTTTVAWIDYFLNSKFKSSPAGNSTTHQFLKILDRSPKLDIAVTEMPSFQLELFSEKNFAPEIAIVTNIYQDHLNRHGSLENYAKTKASLFKNQKSSQSLILNNDNEWTEFLIKLKPKSKIRFFSTKKLSKNKDGIYSANSNIYFQENGKVEQVLKIQDFASKYGEHNLKNLLVSSLAAYLAGCSWSDIQGRISSLPQVPFRQEVVFENKKLTIINDTTATSPDAGIAAINRFSGMNTILITGGTDRQLDYSEWAKVITQKLKLENVIFLSGSATIKMINALNWETLNWETKNQIFETLRRCIKTALSRAGEYPKSVLLFSPAAKSFEKFKNEFDRGRQFNNLVRKELKNGPNVKSGL